MGIEISSRNVEEKKIKRCNRIEIISVYNEIPTVRQDYEIVTVLDGTAVKTTRDISDTKLITDLFSIEYEINGKKINGKDIADFIFTYNDRPDAIGGALEDVYTEQNT